MAWQVADLSGNKLFCLITGASPISYTELSIFTVLSISVNVLNHVIKNDHVTHILKKWWRF